MTTPTLEGIVHGLPEADYHADPALSSTQVKWLIETPAHYRWNLDHPQEHKTTFDLGSAVHTKVLGTGWDVVEIQFENWTTKPAREARDAAYADGLIPILSKDLAVIDLMAESVLTHPEARARFEDTQPEVSVFATEPATGLGLRCRFDRLRDDLRWAVDLKTSTSAATKSAFGKTVWNYGYHVSRAHYLDTVELVTGERPEMLFVVVEKNPPYLTGVFRLSNDQIQMGETQARAARAELRWCLDNDTWPGRASGVQITETPMGQVYEFTDRYERAA